MGRKVEDRIRWFKHEIGFRKSLEMEIIEGVCPNGYMIYYKLLEIIGESDDLCIKCNDIHISYMAKNIGVSKEELNEFFKAATNPDVALLVKDKNTFRSPYLDSNLEGLKEKRAKDRERKKISKENFPTDKKDFPTDKKDFPTDKKDFPTDNSDIPADNSTRVEKNILDKNTLDNKNTLDKNIIKKNIIKKNISKESVGDTHSENIEFFKIFSKDIIEKCIEIYHSFYDDSSPIPKEQLPPCENLELIANKWYFVRAANGWETKNGKKITEDNWESDAKTFFLYEKQVFVNQFDTGKQNDEREEQRLREKSERFLAEYLAEHGH